MLLFAHITRLAPTDGSDVQATNALGVLMAASHLDVLTIVDNFVSSNVCVCVLSCVDVLGTPMSNTKYRLSSVWNKTEHSSIVFLRVAALHATLSFFWQ